MNSLKIATLLTVLIGLVAMVAASGVVSEYWTGTGANAKPLYLLPGESKDIVFTLQNMVGSEDLTFKAMVIKGEEYATITDSSPIYEVPFGKDDVQVHVRITVPAAATIGDQHQIGLSFAQDTAAHPGQFNFGSAFEKYFTLVVGEEPKPVAEPSNSPLPEGNNTMLIISIIVGVLIIIFFIIYLKRRKN